MDTTLLVHSIRMLLNNISHTIRLSSPILVILLLALTLVGPGFFATQPVATGAPNNLLVEIAMQILAVVAFLWVAVAWHRYVLLEEEPNGPVPLFHADRILAYLLRTIQLFVVVFIVSGLFLSGAFIFLGVVPVLLYFGLFAVAVMTTWATYRLSPMLPAAAVDKPIGLREAWSSSAPLSGAILFSMVLLWLLATVLTLAVAAVLTALPLLGSLVMLLLYWFLVMVGISLLTTIYGVSVEGRDI